MNKEFETKVDEIRAHLERATGSLNVLCIGPLDYNIATTLDDVLMAANLLEDLKRRRTVYVSQS